LSKRIRNLICGRFAKLFLFCRNKILITTAPDIAVSVDGLGVDRGGKRLFYDMSWTLPKGKLLAVTGPSGVGKSSLLACLGGRLEPAEGGFKLSADEPGAVGVIFQNLRLSRNLPVLTNVLCGRLGSQPWWRTLFSFPQEEKRWAYDIMCELGIGELANKPVRRISGGEQQRTAIARVLFQAPDIILADEPTSNLDAELSVKVLEIFREQCDVQGRSAICVLHDEDLVQRFADWELSMDQRHLRGWVLRQLR
jgi:phosphonate transport system ATP-binding protein